MPCVMRAGPDLVAAALLHDVGRAPAVSRSYSATPHERAGALWLGPRASAKVAWLVEAHVPAKVFLVSSDPAYLGALSSASVTSLGYQRKASRKPTWLRGRLHEWWPEALQLRRWDDAAKVPGAGTASVEEILRARTGLRSLEVTSGLGPEMEPNVHRGVPGASLSLQHPRVSSGTVVAAIAVCGHEKYAPRKLDLARPELEERQGSDSR